MVEPSQKRREILENRISQMLADDLSYQNIGDLFRVNKGTIHMILNDPDYDPKDKVIRQKLGLDEGSEIIIQIARRGKHGRFIRPDT